MRDTFEVNDVEYKLFYARNKDAYAFCKDPSKYLKPGLIGIDIETTYRDKYEGDKDAGLLAHKSRVRTIQLCDGESTVVLDLFHIKDGYLANNKEAIMALFTWLQEQRLVAHNALFETCHLQRIAYLHGILKPLNIWCTMNMFRLIVQSQDHEHRQYKASLAAVSKQVLNIEVGKDTQTSDWSSRVLTQEQIDYCAADAVLPLVLFEAMEPKLVELELDQIYVLNTKAQEPIAHMNLHGIAVDKHLHDNMITQWEAGELEYGTIVGKLLNKDKLSNLTEEAIEELIINKVVAAWREEMLEVCEALYGDYNSFWGHIHKLDELQEVEEDKGRKRALRRVKKNLEEYWVNLDSTKQLSDWLADNLDADVLELWPKSEKSGYLKTDVEALKAHEDLEIVEPIMKYKRFKKLHSTYGDGLNKFFVEHDDGSYRIHPSFSLCYTATGRMSSFEPNLQNQPRDAEFRKLYVPCASDRKLLVSDFSQIEVRVAAYTAQDPILTQIYDKGLDVYKATVALMMGKSIEDVTARDRQLGKVAVLSLLYGSGPTRLREQANKPPYNLNLTMEEAEDAVVRFREAYPVYREWQTTVSKKAEHTLESLTPSGKLRKLDPDKSYTTSMNTPVQGAAAEIMLHAMVNIFNSLLESGADARLVNVVHDEVIVDCHEDCVDEVKEYIKGGMEQAMVTIFPEATLLGLVDVGVGDNWAEAK